MSTVNNSWKVGLIGWERFYGITFEF